MSVPMEQMEEEMPHMSDDELVHKCMEEVSRGLGGTQQGDGSEELNRALDYYYGRAPGMHTTKAKDPNASRFISMDVQDGIEATVAEIMPTFTTDVIAFYEPESAEDEEQAKMETELCNYLFFERYGGYTVLQTALKDTFLSRNCTVKAYWDERTVVEYETHEDIPEMALAMVMEPTDENQQVEVVYQEFSSPGDMTSAMELQEAMAEDPQGMQAMMQQDPEAQQDAQAAMMEAQDKYTIKLKRITMRGTPRIESVPPENVIVNGDHDTPILNDARFVAHELLELQSDLIAQGYDAELVEELPAHGDDIDAESRKRTTGDTTYGNDDGNAPDRSTRRILVYECYPLVDFDGDGLAERRRVVISNNRLLSNEEWDDVPLLGGTGTIVPHKYQGLSMFDRLKAIQDAKTPIIRSVVDGTQLASNPRVGVVTGQVNLDDLLTSRTGGAVRMDQPNSVVALPNPEVPASSYTMLNYMDEIRAERGGSAIDSANQAQSVQGDTAHGIERVMSAMEMTNAVIARTIGETLIRGIFTQLHELLRKHYGGELSASIGGRWIQSEPQSWKKRTSVSVQIGSSHAERARQAGVLNGVVQEQKELMAIGSPLVDNERLYESMTSSVAMAGVKNPDQYFVDPQSEEGQKAQQESQQKQEEEKQRQQGMEDAMARSQLELAKAEIMKGEAQIEAQRVELMTKQQQMQADSTINMLKLQLQESEQEVQALKDGTAQRFEYDKLNRETALKATELELEAQRDLNAEIQNNTQDQP